MFHSFHGSRWCVKQLCGVSIGLFNWWLNSVLKQPAVDMRCSKGNISVARQACQDSLSKLKDVSIFQTVANLCLIQILITLHPIIMEVENGGLEDASSLQAGHFALPWLWEKRVTSIPCCLKKNGNTCILDGSVGGNGKTVQISAFSCGTAEDQTASDGSEWLKLRIFF